MIIMCIETLEEHKGNFTKYRNEHRQIDSYFVSNVNPLTKGVGKVTTCMTRITVNRLKKR